MDLADDTALRALDEDGAYEATLSDRWWIVTGPNGGLLAALLPPPGCCSAERAASSSRHAADLCSAGPAPPP